MAKNTVTHSCGHDEVHYLYGNGSLRDYRIKQLEQEPCSDCAAKALAEEDRKKAEAKRKNGLPELYGTEKQILWAESIRLETMEYVAKEIKKLEKLIQDAIESGQEIDPRIKEGPKAMGEILDGFIGHSSASWIIDHRNDLTGDLSGALRDYFHNPKPKTRIFEPENTDNNNIVEVITDTSWVSFDYPKEQKFIDIMKAHKAQWLSGSWTIRWNPFWDSPADCAAWMTNFLVSEGYTVKVSDPEVVNLIETNSFSPFYERLITAPAALKNKFNVIGAEGEAKDVILRMSGAMELERKNLISIPVFCAVDLDEFADIYGFHFSDKAAKRMERFTEGQRKKLNPTLKEQEESSGSVKDILNSSMEVIDDLRDED